MLPVPCHNGGAALYIQSLHRLVITTLFRGVNGRPDVPKIESFHLDRIPLRSEKTNTTSNHNSVKNGQMAQYADICQKTAR